jgi:hypothetical protein
MKELAWEESRARIWFHELPHWEYPAIRVAERRLQASGRQNGTSTCLAVEMAVHTGPMIQYGALGAAFLPEHRDNLLIRVLISAEPGEPFPLPLAGRTELAHIGLPEEYIPNVLEDIAQFEELSELGTGILSFERAVYGEVGSSRRFFRRLSHAIVRLLCLKQGTLSDQGYITLLRQNF